MLILHCSGLYYNFKTTSGILVGIVLSLEVLVKTCNGVADVSQPPDFPNFFALFQQTLLKSEKLFQLIKTMTNASCECQQSVMSSQPGLNLIGESSLSCISPSTTALSMATVRLTPPTTHVTTNNSSDNPTTTPISSFSLTSSITARRISNESITTDVTDETSTKDIVTSTNNSSVVDASDSNNPRPNLNDSLIIGLSCMAAVFLLAIVIILFYFRTRIWYFCPQLNCCCRRDSVCRISDHDTSNSSSENKHRIKSDSKNASSFNCCLSLDAFRAKTCVTPSSFDFPDGEQSTTGTFNKNIKDNSLCFTTLQQFGKHTPVDKMKKDELDLDAVKNIDKSELPGEDKSGSAQNTQKSKSDKKRKKKQKKSIILPALNVPANYKPPAWPELAQKNMYAEDDKELVNEDNDHLFRLFSVPSETLSTKL